MVTPKLTAMYGSVHPDMSREENGVSAENERTSVSCESSPTPDATSGGSSNSGRHSNGTSASEQYDRLLDVAACEALRVLQPGDVFGLRVNDREKGKLFECTRIDHPVEAIPIIRCWELEGPRQRMTQRMFRMLQIDRVGVIWKPPGTGDPSWGPRA